MTRKRMSLINNREMPSCTSNVWTVVANVRFFPPVYLELLEVAHRPQWVVVGGAPGLLCYLSGVAQ